MSKAIGILQQRILTFLEKEAAECPHEERCWATKAYFTGPEIALALGVTNKNIRRCLRGLEERGSVKQYPHPAQRKRYVAFGVATLPEAKLE